MNTAVSSFRRFVPWTLLLLCTLVGVSRADVEILSQKRYVRVEAQEWYPPPQVSGEDSTGTSTFEPFREYVETTAGVGSYASALLESFIGRSPLIASIRMSASANVAAGAGHFGNSYAEAQLEIAFRCTDEVTISVRMIPTDYTAAGGASYSATRLSTLDGAEVVLEPSGTILETTATLAPGSYLLFARAAVRGGDGGGDAQFVCDVTFIHQLVVPTATESMGELKSCFQGSSRGRITSHETTDPK
jgi:hypothetical protein